MRDQLADFTAVAWAIVAARQALAVLDNDAEAQDALGLAIEALGQRLCDAAYALTEAMPPPEGPPP